MFPKFDENIINKNMEDEKKSSGTVSYLYDFENGDFIIKNGRLIEIDDLDSAIHWIDKIFLTKLKEYEIYKAEGTREYGTNIKELVLGKKLPAFFIESEVKRDIEESLKLNPVISGIENFSYNHENTKVIFYFNLILKDGRTKDVRKEVRVIGR